MRPRKPKATVDKSLSNDPFPLMGTQQGALTSQTVGRTSQEEYKGKGTSLYGKQDEKLTHIQESSVPLYHLAGMKDQRGIGHPKHLSHPFHCQQSFETRKGHHQAFRRTSLKSCQISLDLCPTRGACCHNFKPLKSIVGTAIWTPSHRLPPSAKHLSIVGTASLYISLKSDVWTPPWSLSPAKRESNVWTPSWSLNPTKCLSLLV